MQAQRQRKLKTTATGSPTINKGLAFGCGQNAELSRTDKAKRDRAEGCLDSLQKFWQQRLGRDEGESRYRLVCRSAEELTRMR